MAPVGESQIFLEDSKVTTNVEISCPTSDEASFENEAKHKSIQITSAV